MRRLELLLLCVVISLLLVTPIAHGQTDPEKGLYHAALSFVADGKWDTAVYTFHRIREVAPGSEYALKGAVFAATVRYEQWLAYLSTALDLGNAAEKATGSIEKSKFLKKAVEYLDIAEELALDWTADLHYILANKPGRYIELSFPAGYEPLSCSSPDVLDNYLDLGVYPGDTTIDDYVRQAVSYWVPLGFDRISPDDVSDLIVKGLSVDTFTVDITSFYLNFGGTGLLDKSVRTLCLQEVLRLTSDDLYSEQRLEAEQILSELQ